MGQLRRNLELKVACTGEALVMRRHLLASANVPVVAHLRQRDAYFRASTGRLKLRQIEEDRDGTQRSRAELIAYHRLDLAESRWSHYAVVAVAVEDAQALADLLTSALGTLVVVVKRRDLALWGATRIHFDDVDGLGCFIELETVIAGQSEAEAQRQHEEVIQALQLDHLPAIAGSYSDLLTGSQHDDGTVVPIPLRSYSDDAVAGFLERDILSPQARAVISRFGEPLNDPGCDATPEDEC